jgi:uncharacterized repeat protein (TIGR03803 family)
MRHIRSWASAFLFAVTLFFNTSPFIAGTIVFAALAINSPAQTFTTLHSFDSTDGSLPLAGLVQGTDGNLYGTTGEGGTSSTCGTYSGGADVGCGTVFKITPTGTLTTLHSFDGTDGENPSEGALIQATDGNFYGTIYNGGANAYGIIFTFGPPAVALSNTSWGFNNQALNETSAAKTFTLRNSGFAVLTNGGITINGNFAISANTCAGDALTMNKTCSVSVTFTPTVLGKQTGTLSFADNAAGSPQTVSLSGTGIEPATLTPTSATYAQQASGTTSAAKMFTLTNNQTVALSGITVSTTGDYSVSATTCGTSLAAKGKCTISVTFTPTATGSRTGQLSVSDSGSNSPQTSSLTGTGVVPATLTPVSATYGSLAEGTTSGAKTFTLANGQTIALTSIAISTTGDFAVSATTCATSLAAKEKCTISVTFTPTATGTRTGELIVGDSASNSPQTSSLTGTGK